MNKSDPAASALILIPLSTSDTVGNRQDDDDVATFLAAAPNEITTGGWTRGTLTDTNLGVWAPDDGNNRGAGTIPAFTWTAPSAGTTSGLLIAYAGSAGTTDAGLVPISHHEMIVTADGNNVVLNAGTVVYAS